MVNMHAAATIFWLAKQWLLIHDKAGFFQNYLKWNIQLYLIEVIFGPWP